MKIRVPSDIARTVRNKRIKELLFCAITSIAVGICIFLLEDIMNFDSWGTVNKVIFYGILIILPWILKKIPFKYFDKSYTGTVVEQRKKLFIPSHNIMLHSSKFCHKTISTIWVAVETDEGKLYEMTVYNEECDIVPNIFNEGDRVLHIAGTDYLQIIPRPEDDRIRCVVCGRFNPRENDKCGKCSHTLNIG